MAESTKPSKDEKETTSDDEIDQTSLIGRFLNQFGSLLSGHNADEPAKNPVLKAFDLPTAAEHLKNCSNVVIMAGAGISTSAGIPDFRSPGTGLYSQLEKYNLPFPEAVFHLDYFRGNPKPFFLLSKELYPQKFTPTPTHYFLRLLNEKNKLLRIYTQNIDSLERIAGVPDEKLIEAHGTFFTSHCLECKKEYDLEFIKEIIFKDEIPHCTEEECKGIVKPDIVFFGEQLPARFNECRSEDFPKADFLIILGTSLKVAPFNLLTNFVDEDCPRLLINMEPAGTESSLFHRNASLLFGKASNRRDVFHQSTCDGGVMELAKLLGWEDDFNELLKSEGVSAESKIPDETEENADRLAEQMAKATLESKD